MNSTRGVPRWQCTHKPGVAQGSLTMLSMNTGGDGGGHSGAGGLTRNAHTSHCMCASVYMFYSQCQTCMTHHIDIATCSKWADVQPSLNTSHGCILHFPINGEFRCMRKLRKSVRASGIAYMHIHTSGGRLVGGGGVLAVVHMGIKLGTPWSCSMCAAHGYVFGRSIVFTVDIGISWTRCIWFPRFAWHK